jgi:putative ATPase
MSDLFEQRMQDEMARHAPLADRMRPRSFDQFHGQDDAAGPESALRRAIEQDELFSVLLWGPPGSGKTSLARLMAVRTRASFVQLSAVTSGKEDLRRVVDKAREQRSLHGQRTLLFVDEIHRWNRAQQDALLPHVESGLVTLVGATTENPSFEVVGPLLSRSRVIVLERLSEDALGRIVDAALGDAERGLGTLQVRLAPEARTLLVQASNGDARAALNALEIAAKSAAVDGAGARPVDVAAVRAVFQGRTLVYDKHGEEHYNVISAFIKSMRASDPDAALYWLARMMEAGEDPLFIARRMVIFASEDVGLADPLALPLAVACFQACHVIGYPECRLNLGHATAYLARAPKSRAACDAIVRAAEDVKRTLNEPVPMHLRNAPTPLLKALGYSTRRPHERGNENLPSSLAQTKYLDVEGASARAESDTDSPSRPD